MLRKLLGIGASRRVDEMARIAERVSDVSVTLRSVTDEQLAATAPMLRQRLERGGALDDCVIELFARLRESARRHLGLEVRSSQLVCGLAIYQGCVAELATGEGKTLAATLPAAAWALEERGVHVMTANPYLARRDAAWMEPVYSGVGLTVDRVQPTDTIGRRQRAYSADVTYGTHLEFGFDYLRDGLARDESQRRQRPPANAIIDEADSVLIDDGRIPLVISTSGAPLGSLGYWAAMVAESFEPGVDYDADESRGMAWLTDRGFDRFERHRGDGEAFGDADPLAAVMHAVRARQLYRRDRHYLVRGGEIALIDEYSGRVVPGRRMSDGLHQAIEAKERLPLSAPRRSMAELTIPGLVGLYQRVGGMTGTAVEVTRELHDLYGLDTVVVAPHRPSVRRDHPDRVFADEAAKLDAAVALIVERHRRGQPVLVGCTTVASSERISARLTAQGVDHAVLNARDDEAEAAIIAEGGQPGAVTVATHLAGRGVDIPVPAAGLELGGLLVVGTERYESARIERQLRGRAGRQGAAGESSFFVSADDHIVRLWGSGRSASPPAERLAIAQANLQARNDALRKDLIAFGSIAESYRREARAERDRLLTEQPEALGAFDEAWADYLQALHDLGDFVHFRAWAAQSPIAAWANECKNLYSHFLHNAHDEPADHVAPTPSSHTDQAEWLGLLGAPLPEPTNLRRQSGGYQIPRAISEAANSLGFGEAVMLDIVAVSDVDGTPTL